MDASRPLLVAAFNDRNEAELAFDELKRVGFTDDNLGFALRGDDAVRGGMITDATGTKDAEGAVKGAATGAAVGGVLAAVAAATIPSPDPSSPAASSRRPPAAPSRVPRSAESSAP